MKKISILLVLSMLVSLLAACGGSESGGAAVPTKELLTATMALFTHSRRAIAARISGKRILLHSYGSRAVE